MGLLERSACRLCPRAAKHQLDATKSWKGICLIGGAQIARGHEGAASVRTGRSLLLMFLATATSAFETLVIKNGIVPNQAY